MFASGFPEQDSFSFAPAEILDANISVIVLYIFARFAFPLSATRINMVQE